MDNIWHELWQGLCEDFSVRSRAGPLAQLVERLLVAAVLGGLLGYTRERIGKEAGLSTHILVAMGSAFFMAAAHHNGMDHADLSRFGTIVAAHRRGAGCLLHKPIF